ncbi:MAG TPA: RluA family pseudouridine synthase [Verrucomicrobiae bacterium]|nr:RluA family pseudouridine synthase [Verrucomicrobiae bacterium]
MTSIIKLSSPATHEYWEVPVLYEDEFLLALDKPSGLLTSPDRYDPARPNLMKLLHAGIAAQKPWARERTLSYLSNAHRLDFETSGVILLAKAKPALVALADLFGSEKPRKQYVALASGAPPPSDSFDVDAPLGPHPVKLGVMRVDRKNGKKSKTRFQVLENFDRFGYVLLKCEPLTGRTHQIRVHALEAGLKIVGDILYGGKALWLSRLKKDYYLKPGREERPLIGRVALHAERLELEHPIGGRTIAISAPWPHDLTVGIKYLRRYSQSVEPPTVREGRRMED